jgi:hypothetical protein
MSNELKEVFEEITEKPLNEYQEDTDKKRNLRRHRNI